MSTVTYTYQSTIAADHTGREGNSAVSAIYDAYRADGRITQAIEKSAPDANNVITNTITFLNQATYDAWYAEIDAIDTTPPSGMSYVGTPVEPT